MNELVCSLNVKDIASSDRLVLEHVLGIALQNDQRLVVQVVGPRQTEEAVGGGAIAKLPEWCLLYHGMTDEEIEAFERTALTRADLTREFE